MNANELCEKLKETFSNASIGYDGGTLSAINLPWGDHDRFRIQAWGSTRPGWTLLHLAFGEDKPARYLEGLSDRDVVRMLDAWTDDSDEFLREYAEKKLNAIGAREGLDAKWCVTAWRLDRVAPIYILDMEDGSYAVVRREEGDEAEIEEIFASCDVNAVIEAAKKAKADDDEKLWQETKAFQEVVDERIETATREGIEALFGVVAKAFPEVSTGDYPPDQLAAFHEECRDAISIWLQWNDFQRSI